MERLTDKNHNAVNGCGEYSSCYSCNRENCYISELADKLGEFEDFMEEQGFESLEELKDKLNKKFHIYNDDVRQGKVFNGVFFSYEQLMVMHEWAEFNTDYLKKYLDSQKEKQAFKDKIQELELAELIRKKEK